MNELTSRGHKILSMEEAAETDFPFPPESDLSYRQFESEKERYERELWERWEVQLDKMVERFKKDLASAAED